MNNSPSCPQKFSFDELRNILANCLEAHGASKQVAALVGAGCAMAERDGAISHGVLRIADYVADLDSGWIDGQACPQISREAYGSAVLRVDAAGGFAQAALELVRQPAIEVARRLGVCVVSISNAHHGAALWLDVEEFARRDLLALTFLNSICRVAPYGAPAAIFGTNPMAVAIPTGDTDPIVFDQSSSVSSYSDIRLAAENGSSLPEPAGLNGDGEATSDPVEILGSGLLIPFGGYKGSSIALMVEVLGAALTGSPFAFEAIARREDARTCRAGQLLILIDPKATTDSDFKARISHLVETMATNGVRRLPAARRYAKRALSLQTGIVLSPQGARSLQAISDGQWRRETIVNEARVSSK